VETLGESILECFNGVLENELCTAEKIRNKEGKKNPECVLEIQIFKSNILQAFLTFGLEIGIT